MPKAPLNEQVLEIRSDDINPVYLEVTLYTPDGPGPFLLAVMNHGSSGNRTKVDPRLRFTLAAFYFLSRGYAVAMPMVRGYGGSWDGLRPQGCNLGKLGLNAATDIRSAIKYLSIQPYIDPSRIVVAGQSFGGWNTLAFGTLNYPVRALINFAGGVKTSGCEKWEASLISAAGEFGARKIVPSLWFYGDNDKLFLQPTWRGMHDRYTKAGGRAELVAFGNFMNDGHFLIGYPEGLSIWTPKVDVFLERLGLPSKVLYPEYLPSPFPPPTNFAAIENAEAVPNLDEKGRAFYREFLKLPMPRVFVISANGGAYSAHSGFDPLERAVSACQKRYKDCRPYAVDDFVVWTKPSSDAQPARTGPEKAKAEGGTH